MLEGGLQSKATMTPYVSSTSRISLSISPQESGTVFPRYTTTVSSKLFPVTTSLTDVQFSAGLRGLRYLLLVLHLCPIAGPSYLLHLVHGSALQGYPAIGMTTVAMMSGFEITSTILTSCQTHSVVPAGALWIWSARNMCHEEGSRRELGESTVSLGEKEIVTPL
jgi:hypothetical protein